VGAGAPYLKKKRGLLGEELEELDELDELDELERHPMDWI